ncbi:2TM domain-containing protein [uncultured Psychroserpens sp.]|uniref:2TM domain-containing protein n=1 Tax=uncultured Psychroserpens sp. TaxID=255436 RepID=UPI002630BE36|nr:2TM domain-containing protein [uncultured Psychroserpens sp.]
MESRELVYIERYKLAEIRVKQLKGYYIHVLIFILVNLVIVFININNLNEGESYFQWHNFITFSIWGAFLLIHTGSVFIPNFIFGTQWENRKIKEFMEKERRGESS